jgi:SAM-dependent methyltransferase
MENSSNEKLKSLHEKFMKHLEHQSKFWDSFIFAQNNGFYQGFGEIQIDGCRSTEKRLRDYDLTNYLSKSKTGLDIGCNVGFFSLAVSRFLEKIVGIEINPYLIDIANDAQEYLKISNSQFYNTSFETFETSEKFDIIFSLANDETIDGNTKFTFSEYVQKIVSLLTSDGILVFESQAADAYDKNKFQPKFEFLKKHFEILENRIISSEYPINVPNRIFLILKNKIKRIPL